MTENNDKIKAMIENALADGRLNTKESEMIRNAIYDDGKVTGETARLWRELQKKVTNAEIMLEK